MRPTYVFEDGLDTLVEVSRAAGGGGFSQYWYHRDDQNNVLALSNSAGSVVEDYEYFDYGVVADRSSMNALAVPLGLNNHFFSGREVDWESKLYAFRHRYLDPGAGRFVSRDPLGPWGDAANVGNAQVYCGNNPWSYVDPVGLNTVMPSAIPTDPKRGDCRTGTSDPVGVKGDCRTGSSDPNGVKGDCRTGSTDPQGVKGDCKSHGSVSRRKAAKAAKEAGDKSGDRVSDDQHQADDKVRIAKASASICDVLATSVLSPSCPLHGCRYCRLPKNRFYLRQWPVDGLWRDIIW